MITEVTNGLIVTRLYENSRATSSQGPKDDVMITEVTNGLIVTRPAKKIEYLLKQKRQNRKHKLNILRMVQFYKVRLLLFQ